MPLHCVFFFHSTDKIFIIFSSLLSWIFTLLAFNRDSMTFLEAILCSSNELSSSGLCSCFHRSVGYLPPFPSNIVNFPSASLSICTGYRSTHPRKHLINWSKLCASLLNARLGLPYFRSDTAGGLTRITANLSKKNGDARHLTENKITTKQFRLFISNYEFLEHVASKHDAKFVRDTSLNFLILFVRSLDFKIDLILPTA
jgi:hypothetical protein